MDLPEELRADVKLKVLIWHLVLSFPHATILSRQVGDTYHVFIIAPYDGGPEKVIQVERAVLSERHPTVDDFRALLESLHLPTLLQTGARYDLRQVSHSQAQSVHPHPMVPGDKIQRAPLTAPSNGEWSAAPIGGTVGHGRFHLSGPFLPSPAGTVSALFL